MPRDPHGPVRRFGTVALALAAGYGVIFGLGELLLSGDYVFDPDSAGSGCRSLVPESEADARPAVIVLAILFGAWCFALGTTALLAIPRDLPEALTRTWRLAMGVVIGLFSVSLGFVVFYHDGFALLYVIFAAPVALFLRLFAAVSIVVGTRKEDGTGKAIGDELIHVALDIVIVVGFLIVAVLALAGLFTGPLHAISEISIC